MAASRDDDDDAGPNGRMYAGGGSRPVPDPTLLTTQQLTREIGSLRDTSKLELKGEIQALTARMDAADKAVDLLEKERDRTPGQMQEKITAHEAKENERYAAIMEKFAGFNAAMLEKFEGVKIRFEERDARGRELAASDDKALQAALSAAKEAVQTSATGFSENIAKSETATAAILNQLGTKITDLGDRVTRVESTAQGTAIAIGTGRADKAVQQGASSYVLAIAAAAIGSLIGVLGLVLAAAAIVIALVK